MFIRSAPIFVSPLAQKTKQNQNTPWERDYFREFDNLLRYDHHNVVEHEEYYVYDIRDVYRMWDSAVEYQDALQYRAEDQSQFSVNVPVDAESSHDVACDTTCIRLTSYSVHHTNTRLIHV